MNIKLDKILAEISAGELIDKITILEIKKTKIADKDKLKEVEKELSTLSKTMETTIIDKSKIIELKDQLKNINLFLWDIEDKKRIAEKNNDFGPKFIELARGVYFNNDKRSRIKLEINKKLNSNLVEVKEYVDYEN